MQEVIALMVVGTGCASLLIAVATWARGKLRGEGAGADVKEYVEVRITDLAEQHERELSDVEERYGLKIGELEERLDFTERLLTQRRAEKAALPPDRRPNAI